MYEKNKTLKMTIFASLTVLVLIGLGTFFTLKHYRVSTKKDTDVIIESKEVIENVEKHNEMELPITDVEETKTEEPKKESKEPVKEKVQNDSKMKEQVVEKKTETTKEPETNIDTNNTITETKTENNENETSTQKNTVSTSLYDSITHGIKEFETDTACLNRGTEIQQKELNDVLDYNEEHDNEMEVDINYFRCYPVIDGQGEGWYLHFFCASGSCDEKLKSKY